MTELELYIELMTVYLYDNVLFFRQILTLMFQITSEGYFSGNFRSPGGSCQLWLAHPCIPEYTEPCDLTFFGENGKVRYSLDSRKFTRKFEIHIYSLGKRV